MQERNHSITQKQSGSNWSIQIANWRDYAQLNTLEKACFTPNDHWPFWDLIGILTLPGYVRLKAVIGEHMIGFIGGEKKPASQRGWVTTLAVLPDFRRKGIALALLERCEEALGMPAIRLSVRESNEAAIGLYQTAGYQLVDRWERYYTGGEVALVYEKRR